MKEILIQIKCLFHDNLVTWELQSSDLRISCINQYHFSLKGFIYFALTQIKNWEKLNKLKTERTDKFYAPTKRPIERDNNLIDNFNNK